MDTTILIIVLLLCVFGGGGWWYGSRYSPVAANGLGIVGVILMVFLILYLMGGHVPRLR